MKDHTTSNLPFFNCIKKPLVIKACRMDEHFTVDTLEGIMKGSPGDYLAVGPYNERYIIRGYVFEGTYVPLKTELDNTIEFPFMQWEG